MQQHGMVLNNRETLEATGVTDVNSFDDREIVLDTTQGPLWIKGEDLHITQLSLEQGKVVVQGRVSLMEYKAPGKGVKDRGKNLMDRLLK